MTLVNPETRNQKKADSLVQLEFAKVVELVAGKTQTPYGHALAEALIPGIERSQIEASLREALESGALMQEGGPLPVGSGMDLLPPLGRLQTEGLRLEAEVLREVQAALETAASCRQRLLKSESCPTLQIYARQLIPIPELVAEIRRSIGSRAEILDSASFELGDLRESLKRERSRVKRQLEQLLQDERLQGVFQETLITDRNGRYVVPVRADHSGRLKGFIHDVSASGQTLYIEPAVTLEGNNRVQTLIHKIAREEERILARLTAAVRKVRRPLADNQAVLARLDLRQAIARLTDSLNGVVPELADEPSLSLRDARHPLLVVAEKTRPGAPAVVPIDLLLPVECHSLIISGPNTGGKTVALKTAGLLVLMVRAGLPIPCAPGSRIFPFAPVMADIGDEQSIEQSLSTFSGHLLRLRNILGQADEMTLVLMDELGTGTDPGEGSALALAAVDSLRKIGARIIATTHLHVVKGYAQIQAQVENAAVEFDSDTLQPTYRLHYGIPGASHAFTIARRIGLPENLLIAAEAYLDHGERKGGAIIERLQTLQSALDEELLSAQSLRTTAEEKSRRISRELEELESRRLEILDDVRKQGLATLSAAKKKLQALLNDAADEKVRSNERASLTSAMREIEDMLPAPRPKGPQQMAGEVTVREILYVPALGIDAEVTRIEGDRLELMAGGKKLRQPRSALRQFQPRRFAEPQKTSPRVRDCVERKAFLPRLVLVGKRVEEAQGLLDRFLDEALLHGERQLEIVHGAGQGVLRNAVREFLAERCEVADFQPAAAEQGGDNITLVELRH
ncbi:MAG: endonuclease MutS2 [Desulfuromonadales bacterium]